MLTAKQIQAARALLGWTSSALARAAFLKLDVIERMEAAAELGHFDPGQRIAVRRALENAGIEFTLDGPQLRKKEH